MSLRIFQVDAFTEKPFSGNPAGVCLLEHPMDDSWMQNVATEMNLSETAFLLKQKDGWSLRWFTPKVEVDLCGHATLATAHVLAEMGLLKEDGEAGFHTRSGLLTARSSADGIELNFPAKPEEQASPPAGLIEALKVDLPKVNITHLYDLDNDLREVLRSPVAGLLGTPASARRFSAAELAVNDGSSAADAGVDGNRSERAIHGASAAFDHSLQVRNNDTIRIVTQSAAEAIMAGTAIFISFFTPVSDVNVVEPVKSMEYFSQTGGIQVVLHVEPRFVQKGCQVPKLTESRNAILKKNVLEED
jgi:hypothetical protein